ncbi:uncharacterized protein [Amphiura filiformis]|uniref:uncharacterized protein n=1 Tax=Amphiura filiformis TaxID=82378 RepID=UPI003B20DE02
MTFFTVTLFTALLMVGVHQSTAGNIEELEDELKAVLETRLEHELEVELRNEKQCIRDTENCTNTAKGGIGPNAECVEGVYVWVCVCKPNYTWSKTSKACVSDSNNARNLEDLLRGLLRFKDENQE